MRRALLAMVLLCIAMTQEDIIYIEDEQEEESVVEPIIAVRSVVDPYTLSNALNYKYQWCAILLIFLYLLNYKRGRTQNQAIIQQSIKTIYPLIQHEFAHIGYTQTSNERPLLSESASEAQCYATGRANVTSITLRYNLRKRQDLLYHYLYELLFPQKDELIIDLQLQSEVPMVFMAGTRRKCKEMRAQCLDLRKLVSPWEVSKMPVGYSVLAEGPEIHQIMDHYVCQRMEKDVYAVHYTDQGIYSSSKGHLRVIVGARDNVRQGIELALHVGDAVRGIKMNEKSRLCALKNREALNASKEKEEIEKHREEMRKKKQEKLRQQEAWIRSLPPEKQKKQDQKRKRKEINKAFRGKTMKVG